MIANLAISVGFIIVLSLCDLIGHLPLPRDMVGHEGPPLSSALTACVFTLERSALRVVQGAVDGASVGVAAKVEGRERNIVAIRTAASPTSAAATVSA